MKKIFYGIFAFMSMGIMAVAQEHNHSHEAAPAPVENKDPNAPEITFEKDVHDFGTIAFGGNGAYTFKFTNSGKAPLIISNANASCGCTVPKWTKEPVTKGESGELNVSYDTKRPGPFTKTVTVNSNAKTPAKVITIKGVVESEEETNNATPVKKNISGPLEKNQ